MTALATAIALVAFGEAARRLARRVAPSSTVGLRASLALVLGAALLCSAYGVLGALCKTHVAEIELVFHGEPTAAPRDSTTEGAGEVRIFESIVDVARATPQQLVPLALACAALSLLVRRGRRPLRTRVSYLHLAYVPLALAVLAALRSVARGYDALWYHLPLATAFSKHGHLEPPGRDLVDWFPANVELLARTLGDLVGPHAMTLVQVPFAIAIGPLCAGVARRVGGSPAHALALALGCPIVVFQSGLAYADVVSLASLAAAAVLLLDLRDEDALLRSLSAGLCLGLALGAKYAALPLLASAIVPIAIYARRRALPTLAATGIGALVPSWFWYVRNLRLTGNPIYPIAVPALHLRGLFLPRSFNHDKELELVGSRAEWWIHPWVSQLTHETGFGAAFATLVPIAIVVLVISLARHPRQRLLLPLSWGLVYLVAWWVGTPHEVRHLLPLVVLFGAPATRLLRAVPTLRSPVEAAIAIGVLVLVRIQLFTPAPEQSARTTSFEGFYGFPERVLDALPDGTRVANLAGRPYHFALFGPRLALRPTEYMDAPPSARDLADQGVDVVFVRGSRDRIDALRQGAPPLDGATRWTCVYEHTVPQRVGWTFWGGRDSDIVAFFSRRALLGTDAK